MKTLQKPTGLPDRNHFIAFFGKGHLEAMIIFG